MRYFLKIMVFVLMLPISVYCWAKPRPHQQIDKQQPPPRVVERPRMQQGNVTDRVKHFEDLKMAYMRRVVNLSPAEEEKFWPVYRQFQIDLDAALLEKRQNNSPAMANGKDQTDRELAIESKILDIRRRYNAEFQKILPPEKVSQVYKGQRDFLDEIIKHNNEKKNEANN